MDRGSVNRFGAELIHFTSRGGRLRPVHVSTLSLARRVSADFVDRWLRPHRNRDFIDRGNPPKPLALRIELLHDEDRLRSEGF